MKTRATRRGRRTAGAILRSPVAALSRAATQAARCLRLLAKHPDRHCSGMTGVRFPSLAQSFSPKMRPSVSPPHPPRWFRRATALSERSPSPSLPTDRPPGASGRPLRRHEVVWPGRRPGRSRSGRDGERSGQGFLLFRIRPTEPYTQYRKVSTPQWLRHSGAAASFFSPVEPIGSERAHGFSHPAEQALHAMS